jgi:2-dehydro-3-deoxygluconokinase
MPAPPSIRFAALGECMIELRHRDDQALALGSGGDTLNCAVYLARLVAQRGVRVDYVTALGDDPYSDAMLAQWRAEGVGTDHVLRIPGRLPGLYMIRTDPQGERTFYYWRSEAAARLMLAGDRAQRLTEALAGYTMLYVSGITLSILDDAQRASLTALLAAARGRGAQVAFDGNFRPRGWPEPAAARRWFEATLRHATIALPTFDDEQALFGDADPEATAARLAGYGVREIAIKLGRDGVLLARDGASERLATAPVEAVDTTAAGDSFNGAYLAARLLDRDPRAAAAAGNRLAGAKVRHRGAIMPPDAMPDLGL